MYCIVVPKITFALKHASTAKLDLSMVRVPAKYENTIIRVDLIRFLWKLVCANFGGVDKPYWKWARMVQKTKHPIWSYSTTDDTLNEWFWIWNLYSSVFISTKVCRSSVPANNRTWIWILTRALDKFEKRKLAEASAFSRFSALRIIETKAKN